jgi:hypothetical protein
VYQAISASGKAVAQDRQIACLAAVCSPFCSPDGPFRRYSLWPGPAEQG